MSLTYSMLTLNCEICFDNSAIFHLKIKLENHL